MCPTLTKALSRSSRGRCSRFFIQRTIITALVFVIAILHGSLSVIRAEGWTPVSGRITTGFAREVSPANVWSEYPRPQMQRPEWRSLNGVWDYAIVGPGQTWTNGYLQNAVADPLLGPAPIPPNKWNGKILIPFCPESALSGVGKLVRPDQLLWYRREFIIPTNWAGNRILLHFEAVDWHAIIWVNGRKVGDHKGGYLPFTIDLSDALRAVGRQQITIAVWDPTNVGDQAVGKQALPEHKKGYRYTPTTGIWQSVWLEPVPPISIEHLRWTPDVDSKRMLLETKLRGETADCRVEARIFDGKKQVALASGTPGQPLPISIPKPKLWSPESPFLYNAQVVLLHEGRVVDQVDSYCGMRKIEVRADSQGIPRICLNGKPVFQLGPLDQGYWPESLLTPPSDAAAKYDLQYLRDIGCNMVRVHIKVHPDRWYYWADKLGLLVWQDFPSTRKFDPQITKSSAGQWEQEQACLLDYLHSHPSIVMWIVFNESWGQYDTKRLTAWTMQRDPSRLVNNASGGTDAGCGHCYDVHDYNFHPSIPVLGQTSGRAMVLGECGGFNLIVQGHTWEDYPIKTHIDPAGDSGREHYADAKTWLPRYASWIEDLRQLQPLGLNAVVYTQLSDIEHECNGWLTYDRKIVKLPTPQLRQIHARFYQTPKPPKYLLPLLSTASSFARFTTDDMPAQWADINFDDSEWQRADRALGVSLGARYPVPDATRGLRLRRSFDLDHLPKRVAVRVVASGRTQLFLNGTAVKLLDTSDIAGFTPTSVASLPPEAMKKFRLGRNVLGVEISPNAKTNQLTHLDIALFEPR